MGSAIFWFGCALALDIIDKIADKLVIEPAKE